MSDTRTSEPVTRPSSTSKLVSASALMAAGTLTYECAPNEFGRSEIKFVTPRNFKIVSQGIAGGLPFAHTVQARRLGDCEAKPAPQRH